MVRIKGNSQLRFRFSLLPFSWSCQFFGRSNSKFSFISMSHWRRGVIGNVQLTPFTNSTQCSVIGALKYSRYVAETKTRKSRSEREKRTSELTFGIHVSRVHISECLEFVCARQSSHARAPAQVACEICDRMPFASM